MANNDDSMRWALRECWQDLRHRRGLAKRVPRGPIDPQAEPHWGPDPSSGMTDDHRRRMIESWGQAPPSMG